MTNTSEVRAGKRSANLSISAELLERAREHDINLSATLEAALHTVLKQKQQEQWIAENQQAIAAYNAHVDEQGVFSDGVRSF